MLKPHNRVCSAALAWQDTGFADEMQAGFDEDRSVGRELKGFEKS